MHQQQFGGYGNIGAISLNGAKGYNNAVNVLNEICKTCYSNSSINAIARSMNIEDIENALDKSYWDPEEYETKIDKYSESRLYTQNICYPYIYSVERCSSIDNFKIDDQYGIKRSEQSTLCNVDSTYKKANKIIDATQTAWSNSNMKILNFLNEKQYEMIFKQGDNDKEMLISYFLASRAVNLGENYIGYGMFKVNKGYGISSSNIFSSNGGGITSWDRIRPMVEIPIENFDL